MYRIAVLTISDRGAAGLREDQSGPLLVSQLASLGQVVETLIIPDERREIESQLCWLADEQQIDLILTSGGTGLAPRDVTPEATLAVIDRLVPGMPEAMRASSLQKTSRAMLSRAVAGIRGRTLIVNMPGSPRAVSECLAVILPVLPHALEILTGQGGECARP